MAAAWQLPGAAKVGGEQLAALVRATPAAHACGLINAAIVTIGLWHTGWRTSVLVWLAGTILINSGMLFRSRPDGPRSTGALSSRTMRRTALAAAISASPWGLLSWMYRATCHIRPSW